MSNIEIDGFTLQPQLGPELGFDWVGTPIQGPPGSLGVVLMVLRLTPSG